MKFKKEELEFLALYGILSDTKSFLNDKINIKFCKEENIVIFSQSSKKFNLITKVECDLSEIKETFSMVIETNKLYQLISSISKDTEIEFFNCGIKFKESKYELQKFDGDYSVIDTFLIDIKDKRCLKKDFCDLNKMSNLKSFIGQDTLNCIGLIDNNFFASNKIDFTGAINSSNKEEGEFYFPAEFLSIISYFKIKSIEFLKNSKFYFCKMDDTYIIFNDIKYNLENIFNKEMRSFYDHDTKVTISKKILLESLNRMSIIAKDNIFNRIFLSFDTNNIVLESIDVGHSIERLPFISIDDEIKDTKIILSVNYLKTIIKSLVGEEVIIKLSSDTESVAIMIEDELKDRFFILILCEENIE